MSVISTQPVFTCSKLTIETPEQGVKYCSKLTIKTSERCRVDWFLIVYKAWNRFSAIFCNKCKIEFLILVFVYVLLNVLQLK